MTNFFKVIEKLKKEMLKTTKITNKTKNFSFPNTSTYMLKQTNHRNIQLDNHTSQNFSDIFVHTNICIHWKSGQTVNVFWKDTNLVRSYTEKWKRGNQKKKKMMKGKQILGRFNNLIKRLTLTLIWCSWFTLNCKLFFFFCLLFA